MTSSPLRGCILSALVLGQRCEEAFIDIDESQFASIYWHVVLRAEVGVVPHFLSSPVSTPSGNHISAIQNTRAKAHHTCNISPILTRSLETTILSKLSRGAECPTFCEVCRTAYANHGTYQMRQPCSSMLQWSIAHEVSGSLIALAVDCAKARLL